jgi:glycosyltransferase involved in cell wall biosynthesis
MRLLIVAPYVPWPLNHGGQIRTFHLVKERAKRHEVTLVCLSVSGEPDTGPLRDICREVHVVRHRPRSARALAGLLAGRGAYNVLRFRSGGLRRRLAELRRAGAVDELQVELTQMWPCASFVRASFRVLSTQNVESQVTSELGGTVRGRLRRALYALESRRLAAYERSAWRAADACAAVSKPDAETIASAVERPARVLVAPNGVDPDHFAPHLDAVRDDSVLLLGGLDYRPNRDAAEWFLREVAPGLRRLSPETRVVVAGRGAGELVRAQPNPRLEGVDDVPDVREHFERAGALVVPLRVGGGSRVKILEAMAAGVPVVASRKAVAGLEVEDGAHLLVADEPRDLLRALESVRRDRAAATARAKAARALVERDYAWHGIVERLERDLERLRAGRS